MSIEQTGHVPPNPDLPVDLNTTSEPLQASPQTEAQAMIAELAAFAGIDNPEDLSALASALEQLAHENPSSELLASIKGFMADILPGQVDNPNHPTIATLVFVARGGDVEALTELAAQNEKISSSGYQSDEFIGSNEKFDFWRDLLMPGIMKNLEELSDLEELLKELREVKEGGSEDSSGSGSEQGATGSFSGATFTNITN